MCIYLWTDEGEILDSKNLDIPSSLDSIFAQKQIKIAAPFVLGAEYRHHVLASQQKIRKKQ